VLRRIAEVQSGRYIPGLTGCFTPKGRAMKDGIHPDYHEITIVMTDGSTYPTRSTYGKPGDTLRLDIDPKSHPAWTGGQQRLLDTGGQLARFNRRFQGFERKS
jgi:large subunit ribosomal protein L31